MGVSFIAYTSAVEVNSIEFWSKPLAKKPGSISYNHASLFQRDIDDSGNALQFFQ